jgi:hypothetical protein
MENSHSPIPHIIGWRVIFATPLGPWAATSRASAA